MTEPNNIFWASPFKTDGDWLYSRSIPGIRIPLRDLPQGMALSDIVDYNSWYIKVRTPTGNICLQWEEFVSSR